MKKVVISHRLHDDGMAVLRQGGATVAITNSGDPEVMLPELYDAEGLIIRIGSIDRETMLKAKRLKVIGRPGVGVDDVDVKAAAELGIPVVIAPGANTRSVAEHAFALMFACAKDIIRSDRETRKGNFSVRSSYRTYELRGKTLGLVGYGQIGGCLAELAAAIGMRVAVFDPFVQAEAIAVKGYRYEQALETVLKTADVISLHVPLLPTTRGLIGAAQLAVMKPNAILINCARGGIVDEAALAAALTAGKLCGAATDVFCNEPVTAAEPLLTCESLIVTPHMAGQTREAASSVATLAARGVLAVMNGERWPHVCNPKAYEHPRWNV